MSARAPRSVIEEKIRSVGIDRDVVTCITVIEGVAVNEAPLRIGKGRGGLGETVDLPVLRDIRGVPYIPGSTLKGAIRSLAEAIARSSGYQVCTPFNSDRCAFSAELLNYVLQHVLTTPSLEELRRILLSERRTIEEIARRRARNLNLAQQLASDAINILERVEDAEKALLELVDRYSPCIVCRLFGNQALAARVVLYDMYPVDGSAVRTLIRTRVAIDRFRDAARSGALFEYEFVPPGYRWRFRMEVKGIDIASCENDECRLLRTLLNHFASYGIAVGGMKSVGHGLLKLLPDETKIFVYRIRDLSVSLETYDFRSVVMGGKHG